jgi:hypothetical protein
MNLWKTLKAGLGDNHAKGDLFEEYAASLFPEDTFTIVNHTPPRNDLNGRFIESKLNPDFQIRHKPSNHLIWVECKFRGSLKEGKIQWSEQDQLERYREFQNSVMPETVYVVIGQGGRPSMPSSMYCIPLKEIEYPGLYPVAIQKYERPKSSVFSYTNGRLR